MSMSRLFILAVALLILLAASAWAWIVRIDLHLVLYSSRILLFLVKFFSLILIEDLIPLFKTIEPPEFRS